jgi:hypothetical protein
MMSAGERSADPLRHPWFVAPIPIGGAAHGKSGTNGSSHPAEYTCCVPVQERAVCRIVTLIPVWIAEVIQTALELRSLRGRNLDPGQNPPVISAMVAVVKQRDVPAAGEPVEELQEGAGPLRELEAEDQLIL